MFSLASSYMIYVITCRSSAILTRRREKKIPSSAINAINLENLNEILSDTIWSLLINQDDPSEAYNNHDLMKSVSLWKQSKANKWTSFTLLGSAVVFLSQLTRRTGGTTDCSTTHQLWWA